MIVRHLQILCSLFASFALTVVLASLPLANAARAQNAVALTGKVISPQEPAMEGVLVSARREGASITTTVVSNAEGTYSFPAERLPAGHYTLSIRAAGYTLQGPQTADVKAGGAATADLTLTKVTAHALADQLSNGEWLNSLPGDERTTARPGHDGS
jgi:hypothetical protein